MASAIFYNAAKKENSTLRPSGGTTIDVKLKDGTDLISPVFILNYCIRYLPVVLEVLDKRM